MDVTSDRQIVYNESLLPSPFKLCFTRMDWYQRWRFRDGIVGFRVSLSSHAYGRTSRLPGLGVGGYASLVESLAIYL